MELFQTVLAFGGALVVALICGYPYLYWLRRLGLGQHIRAEGPSSHQKKEGTPTMGGVIILTGLGVTLFAMRAVKGVVAWTFFLTLGFAALGLADDLLSVLKGRNMGLKARQKLLGQIILACLAAFYALRLGLSRDLPFPFLDLSISLGPTLFFLLAAFAVVSTSNGVNLTDGLDGLAATTVAAAAVAQAALSLLFGAPEMALFCAALAGSCLGFLWFNSHPAAVIMGDTGALALGGALSTAAVFSRTIFYLPLTAGIFLLESLSVILQVLAFQSLGRRIFRMSPLHHHFELGGWAEEKVVACFGLMGLVCGLIALLGAWPAFRTLAGL